MWYVAVGDGGEEAVGIVWWEGGSVAGRRSWSSLASSTTFNASDARSFLSVCLSVFCCNRLSLV